PAVPAAPPRPAILPDRPIVAPPPERQPVETAEAVPAPAPVAELAVAVDGDEAEVATAEPLGIEPAAAEPVAEVGVVPETATAVVAFSEDRLARTLTFMERASFEGLLKHVFALRAFFPDAIAGPTGSSVNDRLAALREALRGQLDRLFIKLRLPRYAIAGKDLEDRATRTALADFVASLGEPAATEGGLELPAVGNDVVARIEGAVAVDRIRGIAPQLENAPLGAVYPWIALCALLGDTIVLKSGERSTAIRGYRDGLAAILDNVAALPLSEFHRVLGTSTNTELDAQLDDVLAALHRAVHATET
ncbi:MAG: hypothetical protein JOY59_02525, partial [Candidatus Eremiobacteraeota bacterium]|nr:hypothetical protein [Candidatus Eremiobacteraeota bacterium]